MMRLAAIATHIPDARQTVVDCVLAAGSTASEGKAFGRLFGFETVAVTPAGQTAQDIFAALIDALAGDTAPDAIVHVHGNPVQPGAGGGLLADLCATHARLRDVVLRYEMDQQNCSTLFWALDGARALLQAGAARQVLILAGDAMTGLAASERYAPGCTAIGDAYVAVLVDLEPGGVRLSAPYLATRADHYTGRFGTAEDTQAFNAQHTAFVQTILAGLGQPEDADARPILGHNVNRLSWYKFCKDTGTDPARIRLDLLPHVGHCYTVDAMLMVPDLLAQGAAQADLLSVGQGGFLAGCRLNAGMGAQHAGA